jgi:hypothetical protein
VSRSVVRARLARFAAVLGEELVAEGVVLGGSVPALYDLPTDCRPTTDLDLLFRVDAHAMWHHLETRLRGRGFQPDPQGDIYRFRHPNLGPGELLDVVTWRFQIAGQRAWYPEMLETPHRQGVWRVPSLVHFLACKFDTWTDETREWHHQGVSHDFEDIWNVLRGVPDLVDELATGTSPAHRRVWRALRAFADERHAVDWVLDAAEPDDAARAAVPALLDRIRRRP